jgi:hypothetical protein
MHKAQHPSSRTSAALDQDLHPKARDGAAILRMHTLRHVEERLAANQEFLSMIGRITGKLQRIYGKSCNVPLVVVLWNGERGNDGAGLAPIKVSVVAVDHKVAVFSEIRYALERRRRPPHEFRPCYWGAIDMADHR